MKQANIIISLHQMYERFSTNKVDISLKCNQGILYRNHKNIVERKAIKPLKRIIIVIVKMSKPMNKLEINVSIDSYIINYMFEVIVLKEIESFSISFEDTNKALKIGKELSKPSDREMASGLGLLMARLVKKLELAWLEA